MAGRESEPFKPWDDGRKGYRLPGEPWDERPCVVYTRCWDDEAAREAYEKAIRGLRIKHLFNGLQFIGYGEPVLDYLREIVKRATGKDVEVRKPMPRARIPGEEG